MGEGIRKDGKSDEKQSIFTKETWGVILLLFSTFLMVCLITGDKVFSIPGDYVCQFLFGAFGYFAFLVISAILVLSVDLIIGKKIPLRIKTKVLVGMVLFCIAIFSHILQMNGIINNLENKPSNYGEYLALSYNVASGGIATSSMGGIITALVAYPLQTLLTVVGSSIIVCIIIACLVVAIVRDYVVVKPTSNKKKEKFRNTYISPNNIAKGNVIPEGEIAGEREYPISNVNIPESKKPNPTQSLFIQNGNNFTLESKRNIAKDTSAGIKLTFTDGGLAVANPSESYTAKMTDDLQKKIEYVKTPAKITPNFGKEERYTTVVSSPIPKRPIINKQANPKIEDVKNTIINEQKNEPPTNIPFFEHDGGKISSAMESARSFENKYANMQETDGLQDESEKSISQSNEKAFVEPTESIFTNNDAVNSIDECDEPEISNILKARQNEFFEEKEENEEKVEDYNRQQEKDIAGESEKENTFDEINKEKIDDFSIPKVEPLVSERKFGFSPIPKAVGKIEKEENEEKEKEPVPINREYFRPPLDLLKTYSTDISGSGENHEERMQIITQTLEDFKINATTTGFIQGPTITRYEVMMPAGVSVRKVMGYDDDLKMRLASKDGVRIEAPIPGKNLVGIEVANKEKVTVGLKELMIKASEKPSKPNSLMFAIGKDIVGNAIMDNLAKGPHYLVAGATGSGKSVCLNVMIISLIMKYSPEELRLILVDPKSVGFRIYQHLPHLMIDEIITEPKRALSALAWAQVEMEKRYKMFSESPQLIMDIDAYNEKIAGKTVARMPRIVIIIDELADLMETCKKDMEARIRALAQKARAAGIHLVLATQRPSVDIITGTIKANLPSRIALKVMNFADSSTILSEGGAEKLLGNGDMLYKNSSMAECERYQGALLTDDEITSVVQYINEHNKAYFDDELSDYLDKASRPTTEENDSASGEEGEQSEVNEFFLKALWAAVTTGSVSISMLQRHFQIGYARAGGLVDKMEKMGYVTSSEGSKARNVLLTREAFIEKYGEINE